MNFGIDNTPKVCCSQLRKSLAGEPQVMRANAIQLTNAQRWEVAKYCIENRGVTQNNDKKFTVVRVPVPTLVKEFNESGADFKVSVHALKESLNFYNSICELTNNLPEVPKPDCSVQENILVEQLKLSEQKVRDLTKSVMELVAAAQDWRKRFDNIRKEASVK